jgi:hypothetical protein
MFVEVFTDVNICIKAIAVATYRTSSHKAVLGAAQQAIQRPKQE